MVAPVDLSLYRHRPMGVFKRAALTSVIATGLAIGAMLRYPGGTPLDRTPAGYSLSSNFLSDLGMTVGYNGQSNRLGAALFVASVLTLVVGLGWTLATIVRLLAREHASRRWASLGAVLGLLACVAFAGVGVTPENRVMTVHVAFTVWGWRIVTLVAGLMAIASFRSTYFHRRAAVAWLIVTVLLAMYSGIIPFAADIATANGLVIQVIAQKVASCVVVLGLIFVAREADRAGVGASAKELVPVRNGRGPSPRSG